MKFNSKHIFKFLTTRRLCLACHMVSTQNNFESAAITDMQPLAEQFSEVHTAQMARIASSQSRLPVALKQRQSSLLQGSIFNF